jgi:TIR domain
MAGSATAVRSYQGAAPEPVSWEVLVDIFDAVFGHDVRDLRRWPESYHHVFARWQDASGVDHEAATLSEVQEVYSSYQTARITFSGWRGDGKPCMFEYWPGGEQVRARAAVQAAPDVIEAMIAPVRAAFPLQRVVVFVSWSGPRGKRFGEAIRAVIAPRLPPAGEVFLSTRMRPGSPPLREMLERSLLFTDAHIVVVTPGAAKSPWVTWETAASWARGKIVIPIFVGTRPRDVCGPLTLVAQGVDVDDEEQLAQAIHEVLSAVGGTRGHLSGDERELLRRAAQETSPP